MTKRDTKGETLATRLVIEKGNEMLINGIAETGKYAIRDYSRKATKDTTPIRWITQYTKPENLSAWLNEFSSIGAMVRTLNGATHYETGHAIGTRCRATGSVSAPLFYRYGSRRRGARGVSVARALTITDNE